MQFSPRAQEIVEEHEQFVSLGMKHVSDDDDNFDKDDLLVTAHVELQSEIEEYYNFLKTILYGFWKDS